MLTDTLDVAQSSHSEGEVQHSHPTQSVPVLRLETEAETGEQGHSRAFTTGLT